MIYQILDGQTVINTITADAEFMAAQYPNGNYVEVPPIPEPPLSALRITQNMIAAIKAERDKRKFGGVKVGTQWLHTDTYSRTQWLGMVLMGASIPAIPWTTMDGSTVMTSQTLAGQVFQGTAKLDAAIFSHASSLIAEVKAAENPSLVIITSGWPATYVEPA